MRILLLVSCCLVMGILVTAGCLNPSGIPGPGTATPVPAGGPAPGPARVPAAAPVSPGITAAPYVTVTASSPAPVYTSPAAPYPTAYVTPGSLYPETYPATAGYPGLYPPAGAVYPGTVTTGPEPSDPSAMTFRHYADQYFAIDYPSGWNVTRPGYQRFTSASGRVVLTAEVDTFRSGFEGNVRMSPDIASMQNLVSREFPGYDAKNIMYDYRNTVVSGVPVVMYSVRLPGGQLAYRRYLSVTMHHVYRFTFSSDAATFDTTAPLREYMFGTLAIYDQP